MKKSIIVFNIVAAIILLGAVAANAQKKKDSIPPNKDSVATMAVVNKIAQFMQANNIGVKDYQLVINLFTAFIEDEKKKGWK